MGLNSFKRALMKALSVNSVCICGANTLEQANGGVRVQSKGVQGACDV